jgi:hypothetical protein
MVRDHEAAGSSPATPTKFRFRKESGTLIYKFYHLFFIFVMKKHIPKSLRQAQKIRAFPFWVAKRFFN